MNFNKMLRILVCLVLVCTLLIGVSPIRAEAVVAEAVLAEVTKELVLGLIIVALAHASGFIVEPPDEVHYADLGEAFDQELPELVFASGAGDTDGDGTLSEDEIKEEVEKVRANIAKVGGTVKEQLGSPEWSQLDYKIYGDLKGMAAIMGTFLAGAIVEGYLETNQEVPEKSGWTYYNYVHLPTISLREDLPYIVLYSTDEGAKYWITYSDAPLYYDSVDLVYRPITNCYTRYGTVAAKDLENWVVGYNKWTVYTDISRGAGATCSYVGPYIWSNYDIYDYDYRSVLIHSASNSSSTTIESVPLEPTAIVSDSIAAGIVAGGTASYSDIFVPEAIDLTSIFSGIETSGVSVIPSNLSSSGQALANGSVTINNYQQSITYNYPSDSEDPEDPDDPTDPTQDTDSGGNDNTGSDSSDSDNEGSDTGDSEQQPAVDTFAGYPVLHFLSKLGELLQNIFDGNLLGVKDFFEPFLSGIRDDLSGIDSTVQDGFDDVIESNQQLNDSVKDIYEQNQEMQDAVKEEFKNQNEVMEEQTKSLGDNLLDGVSSLFTPSDGFFDKKMDDFRKNYAFADSIAMTAKDLEVFLTNLGSVPPVIRINLGAATTSYTLGGEMVFVDFSFYEPYKPIMDSVISAFLWLWFCWRVVLNLPGIIGGVSGLAGAFADSRHVGSDTAPASFWQAPSGSAPGSGARAAPNFQQGGNHHYTEWVRSRNDSHYRSKH